MIISADQIVEMHDHIKACAASSSDAITVLILVAVDTDAVCACAMLTVRLVLHPAARAARRRARPPDTSTGCDPATHAARASPAISARASGPAPQGAQPLSSGCYPHARPQKLLEQDEVSHKVKPVRDYNMLTDIFMNDVVGDGEVGSNPSPAAAPSTQSDNAPR